ncbi:MAG TPA: Fe-S cluster assembly protein SufB, partial [Gaiellaceae bacterium]|nr:Fe-S cluster assembly protein SufB [Gaiellaceae bacterium]
EGCTAPVYTTDSLHAAVVEILVKRGGRCRYTTIQNWSQNVYNLVTKRAVAYENATMEWVDGNLGSKLTMKYPAIWLMGERAHGEVLSIAFAGEGQHQDAGGKAVHVAPNTTSVITSKSISKNGRRAGYRGLLEVAKGVLFLDMDSGLRDHEELVRQYFGTVIPQNDNKFAALNSAVWSGGSFIYVPPGVSIEMPLQAYFRINAENMGQFERTLIIVDEGAFVHYVEGCTAPIYSSDSLHSAVVEIIVKPGARCRYTTIQNWSTNVYNLVTKRAVAYENATMEWVDGNLGSKLTMKYPAIWLLGEGAHGEVLSIAFAGEGQHQDAGGKAVHVAPNTTSVITSKSISKNGGRAGYRGLLEVAKGAKGSRSKVVCDALILDEDSRSDTYPYMKIDEDMVDIGHEATVSKIGEEQLFYLMSRGLTEAEASAMIVSGFVEPITKELPLEYAVEMNRLIQLQMEGSVG